MKTVKITRITGTDAGHFYDVVGAGERGVVGVRKLSEDDSYRVRIQGWTDEETVGELPEGFAIQSGHHASVVVTEESLKETVDAAIGYVLG